MKKMKKTLCLFLALIMCLSLVNLPAFAADDPQVDQSEQITENVGVDNTPDVDETTPDVTPGTTEPADGDASNDGNNIVDGGDSNGGDVSNTGDAGTTDPADGASNTDGDEGGDANVNVNGDGENGDEGENAGVNVDTTPDVDNDTATAEDFFAACEAMGDADDIESTLAVLDDIEAVYNRLSDEDKAAVAEAWANVQAYREQISGDDGEDDIETLDVSTQTVYVYLKLDDGNANANIEGWTSTGSGWYKRASGNGYTFTAELPNVQAYRAENGSTKLTDEDVPYDEGFKQIKEKNLYQSFVPAIDGYEEGDSVLVASGGASEYNVSNAQWHLNIHMKKVEKVAAADVYLYVRIVTEDGQPVDANKVNWDNLNDKNWFTIGKITVDGLPLAKEKDLGQNSQYSQMVIDAVNEQSIELRQNDWIHLDQVEWDITTKNAITEGGQLESTLFGLKVSDGANGNGLDGGKPFAPSAPDNLSPEQKKEYHTWHLDGYLVVKQPYYCVEYNDGIFDGAAFETQGSGRTLRLGDETPEFKGGIPVDYTDSNGVKYRFTGWAPEVTEYVTGDAIYAAQWEKLTPDPVPGLSITKTVSDATAKPGDTLTYTITVTNTGNVDLTNVVVTDEVDSANLKDVAVTLDGDTISLPYTIETLGQGESESKTITITAMVKDNVANGTQIKNTATAASGDTTDASEEVTTTVNAPNLSVTKTVKDAKGENEVQTARPGDALTYTIIVTNSGNADAEDVTVTDDLANESGLLTLDGSVKVKLGDKETECDQFPVRNLTVPKNGQVTITYTAKVSANATNGQKIKNHAVVKIGEVPKDSDDAEVTVTAPDLSVKKTVKVGINGTPAGNVTAKVGETLYYTITVSNSGDAEATVALKDIFEGAAGNLKWDNIDPTREGYTFTVPAKDSDDNAGAVTFTATYEVQKEDVGKEITNKATVNDGPSDDTKVLVSDLKVEKTAVVKNKQNDESAEIGDTIEYTIRVKNTGTVKLEDVTVEDVQPMGLTFADTAKLVCEGEEEQQINLSDVVNANELVTGRHFIVTLDLAVGKEVTLVFEATVNADFAGDSITNLAKATAPDDGPKGESSVKTPVKLPDPTINKAADVDANSTVFVGDEVTYTITVSNTSNKQIADVKVTDDLADGKLELMKPADSDDDGKYDVTVTGNVTDVESPVITVAEDGTLVIEKLTLPAQKSVTITYKTKALNAGTVKNNATLFVGNKEVSHGQAEVTVDRASTTYTVIREYYTNGSRDYRFESEAYAGQVDDVIEASNYDQTRYNGNTYTPRNGNTVSIKLVKDGASNVITLIYDRTITSGNTTEYKLNYDANGGSGAPDTQTQENNRDFTVSGGVPTREGYTFQGWSLTSNGEVQYRAGDAISIPEGQTELTLYAIWESNPRPPEEIIPDEDPPLVDLPDEDPPTTDIPDEEPPLVDIPDEEPAKVETPTEETPVPVVELPDEQVPLVELPDEQLPMIEWPPMVVIPAEDIPAEDIPDEDVPLASVPQTGDYSPVWIAALVLSISGLAVLTLKKREDEEN